MWPYSYPLLYHLWSTQWNWRKEVIRYRPKPKKLNYEWFNRQHVLKIVKSCCQKFHKLCTLTKSVRKFLGNLKNILILTIKQFDMDSVARPKFDSFPYFLGNNRVRNLRQVLSLIHGYRYYWLIYCYECVTSKFDLIQLWLLIAL